MPKFESKFKHLYAETPKPEFQYLDIAKPSASGEGSFVACSATQFAYPKQGGGGAVCVHRYSKPGRGLKSNPCVAVHGGKVNDLAWSPFVNKMLGTASEDCTAKVTIVPEDMEDRKENHTEAAVTLDGHEKKCYLFKWHPAANNIVATCGWEKAVKLWNISSEECIQTYSHFDQTILSCEWNNNGSLLGVTTKAKKLKCFDPRIACEDSDSAIINIDAFEGSKSSKIFWVPSFNWVGATGFNKQAKRMIRLWDLKKPDDGPIYSEVVDQMSSVLIPHMDNEHNVLYLAGKGDSSISFKQLTSDGRMINDLGGYRTSDAQKGGGWVPKRGLDTSNVEIQRFIKLTDKACIPLSFKLDRKNKKFSNLKDLFLDCPAGLPAMTADEYLGGENKDPVTMSMDPEKRTDRQEATFEKKKTYAELVKENEDLKKKIAELESQLGSAD